MGDYDFYTECFQTDWEWWSQYDKGDEGHVIRVMEKDIPDFIAEQAAKFIRYLSANLVPVAAREDEEMEKF